MIDIIIQEYKGNPDKFMFIGSLTEDNIHRVCEYAQTLVGVEDE